MVSRRDNAFDPGLNVPRFRGPLFWREAAEPGQTLCQSRARQQAGLLGRDLCRVGSIGFRQSAAHRGAKPLWVGRLLQPTVFDGDRLNGSIVGQDGAAARQDAAAGAGNELSFTNRPQRSRGKRPLGCFQLHHPAKNHQQRHRKRRQA